MERTRQLPGPPDDRRARLHAAARERPGRDARSLWAGTWTARTSAPASTLLLPVALPGAGFYVGDCHAAQGDGEFCGGGIEVRAEVTLTLTLRKGKPAA